MPGILDKVRGLIFGPSQDNLQADQPRELIDLTGKRKRRSDEDSPDSYKRRRLEMNQGKNDDIHVLSSHDDSYSERVMTPIRRFFGWISGTPSKNSASPRNYRVRQREVGESVTVDLTGEKSVDDAQDDIKLRTPLTKKDLNEEIVLVGEKKPVETIQVSLVGTEAEIQLLKVVNPVIDLTEDGRTSGQATRKSALDSFKFTATNFKDSAKPFAKRLRLTTMREKEIERERNKPANLTQTMKSGRKPHRSMYSKFFFPKSPPRRIGAGVNHCIDALGLQNYANLLNKNNCGMGRGMGISRLGRQTDYSSLFGSLNQKSSFFSPTPDVSVITERAGVSQVDGRPKIPSFSTPKLSPKSFPFAPHSAPPFHSLPSPLHIISQPTDESTPLPKVGRKLSSLEEENKIKEVYSPGFIKGLHERYGIKQRSLERKIREEEARKKYHEDENKKMYEDDVEERINRYLKLTSAVLPEDADEDEDEEEDTTLPDLTPEIMEVINSAFSARGSQQLIEAYRIPITGKDISTLKGLSWLNDEIINFYMQMIVARGGTEKYDKVYAFSTFMYSTYKDNGYNKIRRWTKKVDLFSYDIVLIPVHLGMHWCLATIDVKKKSVNYYDSMGGNNQQCVDLLFKYLKEEHMDKKKVEFDSTGWDSCILKDIPQQMNGSDCGMFACKFAEYISRRARISFTQENMPYFRRRMVYEIVKNDLMKP